MNLNSLSSKILKYSPGVSNARKLIFPLFVEIKVMVTLPLLISAGVGIYVGFKEVLLGVNVPEPPAQIPVVVGPLIEPDKIELGLFIQVNKSIPA